MSEGTRNAAKAVVDIGSNSIKLRVAHRRQDRIEVLLDTTEVVRLGRRTPDGRIQEETFANGVRVVEEMVRRSRDMGAEPRLVGTMALRVAGNASDLVNENAVIALAQLRRQGTQPRGWQPLFRDVGSLALDTPFDELDGYFSHLRIFMGLAGWGPGQLIAELLRGSWFRAHATAEEIFGTPEQLWQRVLKRCGGEPGLWSTWTDSPSWN